ncbi:MAG: MMPL family transporter [Thermodesulfobacteriota bacterium]|nr:MMPL family transporter [Thermodesulfobacteriota bacterium]
MEPFFRLVIRRACLILAAILCITLFFSFHLHKLHVDTCPTRMLVEDLPAKRDYDRFKEWFGKASDDILVVFKADNVFSQTAFEEIEGLTETLESIEGVKRVVSLATLKNDMDILNEWSLEDLKRHLGMADIFVDNMVSADGKVTALAVVLEETYDFGPLSESVEKSLQAIRNPHDPFQIYQIGNPVVGHTLTKYTEKDLRRLPLFTMSIMLVVLWFCFRTLRGAVVPLAAVSLALVWTLGLMGLLNVSLSIATMITPTLLIAVGSAYAMHIMAAYFSEVSRQDDHQRAITVALTRVGLPSIFVSVTTIVGLASLLLNKIGVVKEFATFSCIGLFFVLLIHLTFIPATLSCLQMPRPKGRLSSPGVFWIDLFLKKVVRAIKRQPTRIVTIALALALVSALGIIRIKVETAPIEFFRPTAPVRMAFEDAHKNLAGIYPVNVILKSDKEGYFSSPKVLQRVGTFQKSLTTMEGVDLTISVVDLLKLENLLTRGFRDKERHYVLPDDPFVVKEAIRNYRTFQGDEMVGHFISRDFSKINVVCRTHIVSTSDFLKAEKAIMSNLGNHFSQDVQFHVTGLCIVGSHSSEALTMGQIKSLGLAMVCIFVLLSILFFSAKVGFCAMVPNFFPVLVNFGVMGWAGMHLTVATSLIASIAIGIAVDDTIHYMFRFNQQFHKDFSRRRANGRTIADVGKPIVFTSLAIGLGFSVFLFSSFVPTTVFGLLMLITMASALYGDLFLLPLIMQTTPWLFGVIEKGIGLYRNVSLFRNLSHSEARSVVLAGTRAQFPPGTVVYRKGDLGNGLYLILEGAVRLGNAARGYGVHMATDLGRGQVFGVMGITGPVTRETSATTLGNTILLRIDEGALRHLEKHSPRIAFGLYSNLARIVENG